MTDPGTRAHVSDARSAPAVGASAWTGRGAAYAASEVHVRGASLLRLVERLAPRPGERAVDLGCGAGHTGGALAARGCEVTGVDLDEDMLAAAARAYPALRFLRADAAATGLAAGGFDLACARHTLHHHVDPDATLREARRLLRPGGRFVLVDESALAPFLNGWYDELERTRDPDHRSLRDVAGWRDALARAGFVGRSVDDVTRERIVVADWLDRVSADAGRRRRVHELLRSAPPGASETLAFETNAAGDVIAFAMPMVVAYATAPGAPTRIASASSGDAHGPRPTRPAGPDRAADEEDRK